MSSSFQSQEVPEVCFQGQSLPISGCSLRPNTLTPNFHEVRGCWSGSSTTPGHPHTQLRRWLVDFSSFRADCGSTSRCRSRSDERVGVKTKCQENCAFSITEDYLGVVWDSTTKQTRLSPARIESILTTVRRVREGLSLTVKQFLDTYVHRAALWRRVQAPLFNTKDHGKNILHENSFTFSHYRTLNTSIYSSFQILHKNIRYKNIYFLDPVSGKAFCELPGLN